MLTQRVGFGIALERGIAITLAAAAAFYILLFCVVFLLRFQHPFELSWLEALIVENVQRVHSGLPLFSEPSLEFIPLLYTPLYYYVSAAVSPADGGIPVLRVVSFACALGSFALIALLVRRGTRSHFSGLLAAGLFAATYKLSGFWMDLARIDSMMLVFFLAGLYVAGQANRTASILAGLLYAAAFLTKQTAIFAIAPALAAVFIHRRTAGIIQSVTALFVAAAFSLWWNMTSDGWYGYFAFTLPARHKTSPGLLLHFATDVFVLPLCIAFVFAAWYFLSDPSRRNERQWTYALTAAGTMIGGALSLSKWGGYLNAMLMSHALVCILFGLGFHSATEAACQAADPFRGRLRVLVPFAALIQFVALLYNPLPAIPEDHEARSAWSLVSKIREFPGNLFFPDNPYLLGLAGKPTHAHEVQLADVLAHGDKAERDLLLSQISEAARAHRFAAVVGHPDQPILEVPVNYWPAISKHYIERTGLIEPAELLLRVDAAKFMQHRLFVPHPETH